MVKRKKKRIMQKSGRIARAGRKTPPKKARKKAATPARGTMAYVREKTRLAQVWRRKAASLQRRMDKLGWKSETLKERGKLARQRDTATRKAEMYETLARAGKHRVR